MGKTPLADVMKINHKLLDWQDDAHRDPSKDESVETTIEIQGDRISVYTADGRSVSIELQNGDLRVLSYESEDIGKGAPLIVSIPQTGDIVVDRHDYDLDQRADPDSDLEP